jgi:hypothetical protein
VEPHVRPAAPLVVLTGITWLLVAPAHAAEAVIAVDVPAAGCPGRAEVTAALESRLPGVTRGRGGAGPGRYRLEVNHAAGQAEAPLRLWSLAGGVVLERRLPVEARARPSEVCQALAEAAALVVVRYLRDLGYRPEPTPPPPDEPAPEAPGGARAGAPATGTAAPTPAAEPSAAPAAVPLPAAVLPPSAPPATATARVDVPPGAGRPSPAVRSAGYLGAGAVVRMGLRADPAEVTRGEIAASLQASGDWWHAELGGGVSSQTRVEVGNAAELRLRAFPLRAALGLPVALGGGQLLPVVGMTVDLVSFQATGLTDAGGGLRVEPAAELGVGYRRAGPRWFWRAQASGGFSLLPRDFAAEGQPPAYRAPAAHLRALVEVGPVLWKN